MAGCAEQTFLGDGRTVVVIGDSVTDQSRAQLHEKLRGYSVKIAGMVGATIAMDEDIATSYADSDPSIVVINLGTNDAWWDIPTETTEADLDRLLLQYPHACKVLTTVTTHGTSEPRGWRVFSPDLARAFNDVVKSRADVVVDWSAAVDEAPGMYLSADGVHPTVAGRERLAELTAEAVGSCR